MFAKQSENGFKRLIMGVISAAIFGLFTLVLIFWQLTTHTNDKSITRLAFPLAQFQFNRQDIRGLNKNADGSLKEVSVNLHWSPDPSITSSLANKIVGNDNERLSVTIQSLEGEIDPKDRISLLYNRFLAPNTFKGVEGLQGRVFNATSPYDGEVLFYDPADPRAFFVRCPLAITTDMPEICLREIRLEAQKLDIFIRFPRAWLAEWKEIDAGVLAQLKLAIRNFSN